MATPPILQNNRRKYSDMLREADGWLALARQQAGERDYKRSRDAALAACFALDNAMQYELLRHE